jgi:hypothetical protein
MRRSECDHQRKTQGGLIYENTPIDETERSEVEQSTIWAKMIAPALTEPIPPN